MAYRAIPHDEGDGHEMVDHDMPWASSARPSRPSSVHGQDDGSKATVELASIMTTASNPVSPGPSSPPLDQIRSQDFIPPTRPSSTPFPQPEHRTDDLRCSSCPLEDMELDDESTLLSPVSFTAAPASTQVNLNALPAEIHECVLDHLFGYRVSTSSKSSLGIPCVTKSWGTALRHSRRRELSELALVSDVWRILIQERLYRHIKLKATGQSLKEALVYFANHPHLRAYVKHIEIWFPVFQPKYGPLALSSTSTLPTVTLDGLTNASYVIPADNCSLEETFYFVGTTFPDVCVLTLEGGERKKAPQVRHFIKPESWGRPLPKIPTVKTLVCRGQWNLIRSDDDFQAVAAALPNLHEWHGSYSKPKSKSYLTMATILQGLPSNLTSLSICLEGDYRRELSFPPYFLKVSNHLHFCCRLAEATPALEHLSYTGRVCRAFFDLAAKLVDDPRRTRIRSIDLTVKNCCRHVQHWNESGSGITDMHFINAFEALVVAGIRSLTKLQKLEYLRIRYVDLGSSWFPSSSAFSHFSRHQDRLLFFYPVFL